MHMDQQMKMAAVPDGKGGYVHKLVPAGAAPAPKGRKMPVAPDPIQANPDAAAQQLKLFIERIETLEEERRGIASNIADVLAEAKATGFDVKGIKSILDTYKSALGLEL